MKNEFVENLWLSREVRLGIIVVVLCAAGGVACAAGDWKIGIAILGVAAAMVAAFWVAIVRAAQIPHDAVVVIRLAGPIEEGGKRPALGPILRRGAQSLDHLRYALESAATDDEVRAIVVEIAGFGAGLATAHEIHRLLRAAHA